MKSLSLKNICVWLVMTGLSVHSLLSVACAETIVAAGMLSKDTVWSGEVVVNGLVEVDAGVSLELRPGTNVRFTTSADQEKSLSGLTVYGTLTAVGEQDKPIRFYGEKKEPGVWQGLSLELGKGRPSVMRHCRVENALSGISGSSAVLLAEQIEIVENTTGITVENGFKLDLSRSRIALNVTGILFKQNAEATVHRNRIEANRTTGLVLQGSSPIIKGNTIAGSGSVGLACSRGSSPEISDNLIADNKTGVAVRMMSNPRIVHNEIRDNEIGISFGKMTFASVEYNLINRNDVGVLCNYSAYPEIHYNDLQGNQVFALDLGPKQSSKVSKMGPFVTRNGDYFAHSGPLRLRKRDNVSGQPLYVPDDGIISASNNWWGPLVTAEMQSSDIDVNISVIEDYYDENTLTFRGQIYERDRFEYAPWGKVPFEGGGPRLLPTENVEKPEQTIMTSQQKS